jgi:hypothetical protein
LFPHAIQKPVFSAASTVFEGGCDGRCFGGFIFLVTQGQPGHAGFFNLEIPSFKRRFNGPHRHFVKHEAFFYVVKHEHAGALNHLS